jgi:hypothetical protein
METRLDHTYLRPGIISRAAAVGLAALGIGAGIFLAAWGLSFLWYPAQDKRIDALVSQLETMNQKMADAFDDLKQKISQNIEAMHRQNTALSQNITDLDRHVGKIELKVNSPNPPIIVGDTGRKTDNRGNVIEKEVTVFHTVKHEGGDVVTGWRYPDGASADQRPMNQYCYWNSDLLGGTTSQAMIHIAVNSTRLPNIGAGVPRLEEALQKCSW